MAWCENTYCLKDGLRKADIEFCEASRKVLCHGCYAIMHPGWVPPPEFVDLTDCVPNVSSLDYAPKVGFALQISDADGIKAKISYGEVSFAVHAPAAELKRLFGG